MVELILSGIYVWSLLKLLNLKSSVRQRRVMRDLIYVNVILVLFDILVVILLYLNQTGISHPIQIFSYALKLKLEFVVLNQLMAVAARGLRKETFEEQRYHHSSTQDAFSAECRRWDEKTPSDQPEKHGDSDHDALGEYPSIDSTQLSVPEPVLSRGSKPQRQTTTDDEFYDHNRMKVSGIKRDHSPENFLEDDSASSQPEEMEEMRIHPSQACSGETLRPHEKSLPEDSPFDMNTQRLREAKRRALRSMRHPLGQDESEDVGIRRQPMSATIKRHNARRRRNSDGDEEEEIGLHMWEKNGKVKLETPWFKSKVEA